jgi:phage terminase large subunit-like protein
MGWPPVTLAPDSLAADAVPSFAALTETEQRAVAERLLKIEQSGWKPFWCPRPDCDGMPHRLLESDPDTGEVFELWVSGNDVSGPNGEPVGEIHVETEDGEEVWRDDPTCNWDKTLPEVGRPVLDPNWAHNHARADQRLPSWKRPWTLMVLSGRGAGKTRTGVEFVTLCARKGLDGAIVGRRGTELENTHVRALIEHAHPEFVPTYLASKDLLVWPNGATTYLFSAERPENIRSVNLSYCWFDEAAHMDEVEVAWMNAKLATRIETPGNPIHMLITSTPTPTKWVMAMEDDPEVEVRRVSTYANRANLSADFVKEMERSYEGTRMGRQELHGEVLRDVEGALWNDEMFRHLRVDAVQFAEIVAAADDRTLAVDPAGSKGPRSDAHGIVGVLARHTDENGDFLPASEFDVVLDATIKGNQSEMCAQVFKAARLMRANRIVVEKNFGGEAVKQNLVDYAKLHPAEATLDGENMADTIVLEHAAQSKEVRAEPTVGKYEQGRVTHVSSPTLFGDLSELEKEQIGWVPKSRGGRMPSPNRIDALVWAIRAMEARQRYATQQAGRDTVKKMKKNRRAA